MSTTNPSRRLALTINLDGAAFAPADPDLGLELLGSDEGAAAHEVARILTEVAHALRLVEALPTEPLKLRDYNGNTCGRLTVDEVLPLAELLDLLPADD